MKILLSGATGRVGQAIERLVAEQQDLEITGRASSQRFFAAADRGDVLIDFSRPSLTRASLDFAVEHGTPVVIGTTGLEDSLRAAIDRAAGRIAICQAANFSIGIQVLLELVAQAAAKLPPGFDIEIAETHHRWKVDAPSGTALALGRTAARARGLDSDGAIRQDGPRQAGAIGYQVARGGDVVGEHSVAFLGDGERLELSHRATDRTLFARGAVLAARWLIARPPGLYGMRDVLDTTS